jgi:arylsulfatase
MDEMIAPRLKGRPHSIAARLSVPDGGEDDVDVDGVLVAHGGHAGGYALYVRGRRLCFTYNFVGTEVTTVTAEVELPPGEVVARMTFTPGVERRFSGDVHLWYDDVPVGEGFIPRTTPYTYGTHPFAVGYQPSSPIVEGLAGRAAIDPRVAGLVVIEVAGRPTSDATATARKDLATQ